MLRKSRARAQGLDAYARACGCDMRRHLSTREGRSDERSAARGLWNSYREYTARAVELFDQVEARAERAAGAALE